MQISKSQVEVYKIRNAEHGAWADITIDAKGNTGRISISSDYGDWAYYWGSCGCPFKEFLCGLDLGYVSGKFRADNHFDLNATIQAWKEPVLEYRRKGYIDAEEARELFDEILKIDEEAPNMISIQHMVFNTEHLFRFFEGMPHLVTDIEPGFRIFWNNIWKPFTEELKKETLESVQ